MFEVSREIRTRKITTRHHGYARLYWSGLRVRRAPTLPPIAHRPLAIAHSRANRNGHKTKLRRVTEEKKLFPLIM